MTVVQAIWALSPASARDRRNEKARYHAAEWLLAARSKCRKHVKPLVGFNRRQDFATECPEHFAAANG